MTASRAMVGALALSFLLAPLAVAQRPPVMISEPGVIIDMPLMAELRVDSIAKEEIVFSSPFLVVGLDTVLNLTVRVMKSEAVHATFRLNATGATVVPDVVTLDVDANGYEGVLVTVHPDDAGLVEVVAIADDAFQPNGDPLVAKLSAFALSAPSVRIIDPPPVSANAEPGFERSSTFGSPVNEAQSFVRLRSGESIAPRLEVRNVLPTAVAGFSLRISGGPTAVPAVEVPSLEPGALFIAEVPTFSPTGEAPGGFERFYGAQRFDLRATGDFHVAGADVTVQLARYAIENGAVVDVLPANLAIEVQDGVAIDLLVPKEPRLGVPTRVKFYVTNMGTEPLSGRASITLQTPYGMFYEVQGPMTRDLSLDLAPNERTGGVIEFTPRVAGGWVTMANFYSSEGFGYGGGGGSFVVHSPVAMSFDQVGTVYARIGERISVDIGIATSDTLDDAQLRVTTGEARVSSDSVGSGEFRPGLAQSLLDVSLSTASLGTLRPGGALNATVDLVGRSSGSYQVVPYILSGGFAYTPAIGEEADAQFGFIDTQRMTVHIAVQPRPVPSAMALAPLTLGLAFFVGAWTLRTRFVK